MSRTVVLAICLLCAACGNFQLGTVQSPPGRTADQRQLDILSCKDQAQLAIGTAGHQVGDFLLGMTIIGTPIAYESDKQTERDVFASCMRERGYNVVPPKE
jgi:hypothetical protein